MTGTHFYPTLDEALEDIAQRSFYESAIVTKEGDGTYSVTDYHTGVEDTQEWTYADGIKASSDWLDYSRLHEAYEYYAEARHIRFNLASAVEAIEAGKIVGFTYVVCDAPCEDDNPEECFEDHTAGWAVIATIEEIK